MTEKTKIELRQIEIKKRLREIAGLEGDAVTSEVRSETETLTTENTGLETSVFRLCLIAENDEVVEMDAEVRRASAGCHRAWPA